MTQANAGFDIGAMNEAADATFNVGVIQDEEGNDKSGFVIVGKNSDRYRQAAHKLRVTGLVRASKRKAALDTTTDEGAEAMAKTIESNDATLANSVVVDWFGFANNGVAAQFDAAVAQRMLAKFPTWQMKVLEALENDANFIRG